VTVGPTDLPAPAREEPEQDEHEHDDQDDPEQRHEGDPLPAMWWSENGLRPPAVTVARKERLTEAQRILNRAQPASNTAWL
jgi:ABC-type Zn2+ transport system substrate-binding protein/surface adhesin